MKYNTTHVILHWLSWKLSCKFPDCVNNCSVLWFISREHVCVLQPASNRQTGADVHCGFSSQRCVCVCYLLLSSQNNLLPSPLLCHCDVCYLENMATDFLLLSADCSKTFRVSLSGEQEATRLHPLFIPMGQCTHRHFIHTHTHTPS